MYRLEWLLIWRTSFLSSPLIFVLSSYLVCCFFLGVHLCIIFSLHFEIMALNLSQIWKIITHIKVIEFHTFSVGFIEYFMFLIYIILIINTGFKVNFVYATKEGNIYFWKIKKKERPKVQQCCLWVWNVHLKVTSS